MGQGWTNARDTRMQFYMFVRPAGLSTLPAPRLVPNDMAVLRLRVENSFEAAADTRVPRNPNESVRTTEHILD